MPFEERVNRAKNFCIRRGLRYEELDSQAQKRVNEIQTSDYTWSPGNDTRENRYKTTFRKEFEKFLKKPGTMKWDTETYKIKGQQYGCIFFKTKTMDNFMVIRRQIDENFCLSASVTFQHYLECVANNINDENHTTFDISVYIREKATDEQVKQFILNGSLGMNSKSFVSEIVAQEKVPWSEWELTRDSNMEAVKSFGKHLLSQFADLRCPALVSIDVGRSFNDGEQDLSTFEGKEQDFDLNEAGEATRHAMVCIGVYKDEADMVWLLIQNSWKNRYFQEISVEYLGSCNGKVRFIDYRGLDISLKDNPTTINAVYAEASCQKGDENDSRFESDRGDY